MSQIELEEPFPLYAIPRVWLWMEASITKRFDDAAPKTLDDFMAQWLAAEGQPGRRSWAVIRDGVIGGMLFSNRLTEYVADLHVVFKKEFYGHKTTQKALAMVLEELYAPEGEPGIIKIESKIMGGAGGRTVKHLVLSVGGTVEGIALGHSLRDGQPIDVVMVGIERSKFNVWNRRRLQLEQHLECVSEHGNLDHERDVGDKPELDAGAGGGRTGHLRDDPSVSDEPAGGGQPGQNASQEPSQRELLRAG